MPLGTRRRIEKSPGTILGLQGDGKRPDDSQRLHFALSFFLDPGESCEFYPASVGAERVRVPYRGVGAAGRVDLRDACARRGGKDSGRRPSVRCQEALPAVQVPVGVIGRDEGPNPRHCAPTRVDPADPGTAEAEGDGTNPVS